MFKLKNFKSKFIIAILISLLFLSSFSYVRAEDKTIATSETQQSEDTENVEDSQTENEDFISTETQDGSTTSGDIKRQDLYLNSDKVNIDYLVSGNVYIMASDVTIDGVIDGNVFICASNVTFTENSYVYSDVFVCAKSVTLNGYLYDLYCASNSLNINKSAYIIRDIHVGCDSFSLNGTVKRNVFLGANNININDSSALIGGDFKYSSANSANFNPNIVSGSVDYSKSEDKNEIKRFASVSSYLFSLTSTLLYSFIIILIIVLAMNKFTDKSEDILKTKFWPACGFGALALIIVPIVCIILCCTIIGVGVAIALLALYVLAITITSSIVGVALGKLICTKMGKNTKLMIVLMSILVVLGLWILSKVPFIGWLVSLATTILGLGIIIYSIFNNKDTKSTVIETKQV